MDADLFLQQFGHLAQSESGIKKLRNVILQLAVRGKLVEIPESAIAFVKLERLGNWAIGCGFPTQSQGQENESVLFCKVSDMNLPENEKFILRTNNTISYNVAKQLKAKVHPVGTVIFPKIGGAIATGKRRILSKDTCIDNNCLGIIPSKNCSTEWLYLVLCGLDLTKYQSGTSVPALSQKVLEQIIVSLPSSAEQKRIVAKVDELMVLCDRLEDEQKNQRTLKTQAVQSTLHNLTNAESPASFGSSLNIIERTFGDWFDDLATVKHLRANILQLAVQGKLVPQNPTDEPASELLKRFNVDVKRWSISNDDARYIIPISWIWLRFAGVGEQRLGKMLDAQKNRGTLRSYLRNTNVQWMRFDLYDLKMMRVEDREEKELRLQDRDLLICEGGEPGRCAIWHGGNTEMYFQKALHRVRPCGGILSEYLAMNLQVDCQNEVLPNYFTGATIKHLTGRSLSLYSIPIPPLAEQKRIVAKVDELMTLCDQLEAHITHTQTLNTHLMDSLIHRMTEAA